MLPRGYLAKKLAYPLHAKDGSILRTVGDASAYMIVLPKAREMRRHWQHAAHLMLEQADAAAVTRQVHPALFLETQLDLEATKIP